MKVPKDSYDQSCWSCPGASHGSELPFLFSSTSEMTFAAKSAGGDHNRQVLISGMSVVAAVGAVLVLQGAGLLSPQMKAYRADVCSFWERTGSLAWNISKTGVP